MKKILLLILISLFDCSNQSNGTPYELINLDTFEVEKKHSVLVNPSQTKDCDLINYKEVEFIICYNEKHDSKIDYIFVNDENYITANNIKIGSTYDEVKKVTPNAKIINIEGWAKVVYLPSKWIACFNYNEEVKGSSKINSLYYWNEEDLC